MVTPTDSSRRALRSISTSCWASVSARIRADRVGPPSKAEVDVAVDQPGQHRDRPEREHRRVRAGTGPATGRPPAPPRRSRSPSTQHRPVLDRGEVGAGEDQVRGDHLHSRHGRRDDPPSRVTGRSGRTENGPVLPRSSTGSTSGRCAGAAASSGRSTRTPSARSSPRWTSAPRRRSPPRCTRPSTPALFGYLPDRLRPRGCRRRAPASPGDATAGTCRPSGSARSPTWSPG